MDDRCERRFGSIILGQAPRGPRCGQGSVTEVATDLGFFHFGRFAGEYRAMFGEPPSETLRRSSGMGTV